MNIKRMESVNEFQTECSNAKKNRSNFPHYQNSFVSIFIGDFLPFYKAILIETCADYNTFHAVSNTIETMKKFLLITEILTHEYKDNGNPLMSFKLSVRTLR